MNLLSGHDLRIGLNQFKPAVECLKDKIVICFYFSAHWCPPCRQFTPVLKKCYNDRTSYKSEIVFVSSDRNLKEYNDYIAESHGSWLSLPFESALKATLNDHYAIRGIPCLIAVNAIDGTVIARDGRRDLISCGASIFTTWESLATLNDTSTVALLKDNKPDVRESAAVILIKLIENIIREPNNIKYRKINLSNEKIYTKLLPASGAFEILFSIGFEEGTDNLFLPLGSPSLSVLIAFRDSIKAVIAGGQSNSNHETNSSETLGASNVQNSSRVVVPTSSANELQFFSQLRDKLDLVQRYEDELAIAEALTVLPIKRFEGLMSSPDDLLLDLLKWFKVDFFSWVDSPKCENPGCQEHKTTAVGRREVTKQEVSEGATVVEMYVCDLCKRPASFIRYHSFPAKLLETRNGRCGEWANCFALIGRALNFDVRFVFDWSDHVWCEFYSQAQKRWLHCDPCEGICDQPLIYERGWGKKISYVFAVSKDEIVDVTWRYTIEDHALIKSRRTVVTESWLCSTLAFLNADMSKNSTSQHITFLSQRRILELADLVARSNLDYTGAEADLVGRQSGSQAWRESRGEIGKSIEEYVWVPTPRELDVGEFRLVYDIVQDCYKRINEKDEKSNLIFGWKSRIYKSQGIQRKEEYDWKMVYLARTENSQRSSISWRLSLESTSFCVENVELEVNSCVYETGHVLWQLCGENACILPTSGKVLKTEELSGSKCLTLTATLSGGKGNIAWQQSQLFRTSFVDNDKPQLIIVVKLKKEGK